MAGRRLMVRVGAPLGPAPQTWEQTVTDPVGVDDSVQAQADVPGADDEPPIHWSTIVANSGCQTADNELTVVAPESVSTEFHDSDKPDGVGDSWENPWIIEDTWFKSPENGFAARIGATFILFRNCKFELHEITSSLHGVRLVSGASAKFQNCDMFCEVVQSQNVFISLTNDTVELYRCNVWHGADGIRCDSSNTLVEECYVHDLHKTGSSHNDNFQNHFGGNHTDPDNPGNRYNSILRNNVLLFPYGQMQTGHMLHSVSNHTTSHVFYHDHEFTGNWIAYGSAGAAFASVNPDGTRRMVDGIVRRNAFAFTMEHPGGGNYDSRTGEPHWTGGTMANNMESVDFADNWLWVFDYPTDLVSSADTIAKDFSGVPYDDLHEKVTAAQAGDGSYQPDPLPEV